MERIYATAEEYSLNEETVLSKARIGLRPKSADPIPGLVTVPVPFDNIEGYVFVPVDVEGKSQAVAMLTKDNCEALSISAVDLIKAALDNTKAGLKIQTMAEALGLPSDVDVPPILIVSNDLGYRGAGSIMAIEEVHKACKSYGIGDKICAIPSSIHEWLIFPDDGDHDFDELCELIQAINPTIDPEDVLDDRPYFIALDE